MMDHLLELLAGNALLLLFAIVGLGFLLGSLRVAGLSLGVAAVLFVSMAFGAWDARLHLPEELYVLGLVLLVGVEVKGVVINGAKRWIGLGPLSFQPSEIAKWGVPLIVAWHCCRRAGDLSGFKKGFLPPFVLVSAIAGLVALEDLGTAVLIMVVALAMLVSAGVRWWHVGMLLPAAGAAVVVSDFDDTLAMSNVTAPLRSRTSMRNRWPSVAMTMLRM